MDLPPAPAPFSTGAHAAELIARLEGRLVELHPEVLADEDPEPLHRMRVSMRRLRTCLRQFAPALELPAGVSERRIAKAGRRLGMARDLDVLRDRLEGELMPGLPANEREALRPVLKQLRRERRLAYEQMALELRSGGYLELLARLQGWLRSPRFSVLGRQPLRDWLLEWQAPLLIPLFVHPGWFVAGRDDDPETVHDLRKQFKSARYALENLLPVTGPLCRTWAERFRDLQDRLGEINDLLVLRKAIDDQLPGRLAESLPVLHSHLDGAAARCWLEWRGEAERLQALPQRRSLLEGLLREPEPATLSPANGGGFRPGPESGS
jgi:CHAD domain-containing protein